ncbi:hypothetical protein R6Q57_019401 [Mikania cordata]
MVHEKDQQHEKGVVVKTPERTQIAAPISKFEDSPVFSYINSLSPIKPVKSVHFTQTLSTLSFASLPSVFTSPHAGSFKDSKSLKRNQFSDQSNPELTSDDAKKAETSEGIFNATQNTLNEHTDFNSRNSITDSSVVPLNSCSNLESRKLNYETVSPDTSTVKMVGSSASSVPFIINTSENDLFRIETKITGINQVPHNKEVSTCEWDSFISDDSELLNFNSPSDTQPYKVLDHSMLHPTSFNASLMNAQPQINGDNPSENDEGLNRVAENHVMIASTSLNNFEVGEPMEETDNEADSNLYRGIRRRCLLFEIMGSWRKHSEDVSNGSSANVSESNQTVVPNDNNSHPLRNGNDSSRCILPGIGLHLNAIASNLADHKVVKHESLGSGRQFIIATPAGYPSVGSSQELMTTFSDTPSFENDTGPALNDADDASKTLGFVENAELNQSQTSPRKKRQYLSLYVFDVLIEFYRERAENAGETEACKRCNCKKSKCLKLYCECFAAGVYCVEPCSCHECFNKPIHEDTVLATRKQIESRNPLAFAPKVIKTSDHMQEDESNNTPASARHKRGCNCKKSGCLKKYCECYQGGVGCSVNCRCEGCKNTFGRKDGSGMDLEVNECDGNGSDGSLLHIEAEPVSTAPATPSCFGWQSISLLNSKGRPPRSFMAIGSFSNQRFEKLNSLESGGTKLQLQTVGENKMPDILEEKNGSSMSGSGVKSCSPNSKRVSPPHSIMGQRSSRKLILQSIPSFPCLNPNPNQ